MKIRSALIASAALIVGACTTVTTHHPVVARQAAGATTADVLIRGGTIFDGTTGEPYVGDVAIAGDRIIAVGKTLSIKASRVEDASGMIVAPGFIDAHTHPDTYIRSRDADQRINRPWLNQGVSTIVIGVDGYGTYEIAKDNAALEASGVGTNFAALVGFGPIRTKVLGEVDRAPTASELKEEQALVAKAMCEGAFGFSTGLFYAPQTFAKTDEVIALAREAAKRGGLYDSHQRDESSYSIGLLGSVDEAIRIGREAGLPVHFAHIKALGVDVHGQSAAVIAHIEKARAEGMQVTADQYPWLASGSNLEAALVPHWAVDGGYDAMLARFADPQTRRKIIPEMEENLRRRGGADSLLLTATGFAWSGKRLSEIATQWGLSPVDAAIRILSSDEVPTGTWKSGSFNKGQIARTASFNMAPGDIEAFMRQPWVVTGSDGSDGHPRQYATFPEKYAKYVREKHVLTTAQFIRQSTGATADMYGIRERGYLKDGYFADVVVLDPDNYRPRADYLHPRELTTGVVSLYVNGVKALQDGLATGRTAGRALAHQTPTGACK